MEGFILLRLRWSEVRRIKKNAFGRCNFLSLETRALAEHMILYCPSEVDRSTATQNILQSYSFRAFHKSVLVHPAVDDLEMPHKKVFDSGIK